LSGKKLSLRDCRQSILLQGHVEENKEEINKEKQQNKLLINGKANKETEERKDGGINERKWKWILKN
jgi:hypothetical protein